MTIGIARDPGGYGRVDARRCIPGRTDATSGDRERMRPHFREPHDRGIPVGMLDRQVVPMLETCLSGPVGTGVPSDRRMLDGAIAPSLPLPPHR